MPNHAQKAVFALLFIGAVTLPLASCKNSPTKSETEASAKTDGQTADGQSSDGWASKMRSLSTTLSSLLPLVSSKAKFNDDKNLAKIEENTRQLRNLAHSLKSEEKPNSDPSLRVMSGLFEEDIERALESLRGGHLDYARQILKDTTAYCIQCHTQTNAGPKFPTLNLDINLKDLTILEQAEFFAATRQFDRALESYRKALASDQMAGSDPFTWEQAARSALAIIVRVKDEPSEAQKLLTEVEKHPSAPTATKKSFAAWKKSIDEWKKEKAASKESTEIKQVTKAMSLIQKAQKRQEFPLDHSQDVLYFRAASLLHSVLEGKNRDEALSAKALYWAGIAAEATRDMNFWTLHESYYEQCIRVSPHTPQAKRCFEKLNDSVTLGYSGSGGTRIPPEITKRLNMFRALMSPEQENKNQ